VPGAARTDTTRNERRWHTQQVPTKRSAGILLYRRSGADTQVLLGHLGGPFWSRRDVGGWSLPKGEYEPAETPEHAARREFEEELGVPVPSGELAELGEARQSGGKLVTIWCLEGDVDPTLVVPGTFEMEWPKGSGRTQSFPELDRVEWFGLTEAHDKVIAGQRVFLDRLAARLDGR
jgi:predicted NUDIX family NTP pyrophosphohydrolase